MKCERSDNWLTLELEQSEKELLLFSLEEIQDHYSLDEGKLREPFKRYWKGRLSSSKEDETELGDSASDLSEARWGWKSERLELVKKWLAEESTLKVDGGGVLVLDQKEAEQLLCVLNDRRLLLAIEHNLDEDLLAKHPPEVSRQEIQQALWEIHFLAFLQQYLLEALG